MIKSEFQNHPVLNKAFDEFLIRNIMRFKADKYDKALNGFEEYIHAIDDLFNRPENFWFQKAIAMCFLSMIYTKKEQQKKSLSILYDVHTKIMKLFEDRRITLNEDIHDFENKSYDSQLSQTIYELTKLAEGDENKTKLVSYLKQI